MPGVKTIELPFSYGFPMFTKQSNLVYLCSSKNLIISDIWAFWDYVIKKNNSQKAFLGSLLEQAKFFYLAAETSPVNSKPLLYYYSFLNFAKVLINMRFTYGQGAEYMHGINETNNRSFSRSTIEIFPIKAFKKNVAAELYRTLDEITLTVPLTIGVKDLLHHCVGIHRTYCEIYGQSETFYKIEQASLQKTGSTLTYRAKIQCNIDQAASLRRCGYSIDLQQGNHYLVEQHHMASSNVTRMGYYDFSRILVSKGLWYYLGHDGYSLYLSDYPNNRYSPEFIIYNTMFYLGSITRYHPYLFEQIFSDKEQWLMSEFLTTQPKQFLYLSTAKILSQIVHKAGVDF